MSKKAISIIIPCYNCAETIKETLQSVESKSFNDYEVIIINDGSTDLSEKIINEYKRESLLDIRLINQQNSGVSVARNRGIEESTGEYLLFLDGDDLFAEGYIEAVSYIMNRFKTDTMSCYRTIKQDELTPINEIEGHYTAVRAQVLLEEFTYSKKRYGFTSFVYKKSILDKYKIRFFTDAKYGEDWEFATKYLAHCSTAINLHYYYYYYRILTNSASRTISFQQVDAVYAAERTAIYLEKLNHPFAKRFKEYMYNRALFSVAHRFAKGKKFGLYKQFIEQFPVKSAMIQIKMDSKSDFKSKLAAQTFLISPICFYAIARR